jgi:hypothetical protein
MAQIEGLILNPEALAQYSFPFPLVTTIPILALAQPKGAIQCRFKVKDRECGYICCLLQQIRNHCTNVHQWKSSKQGGRPRKVNPQPSLKVP